MTYFPNARLTGAGFLSALALYLIGAASAILSHQDMDLPGLVGGLFSRGVRPDIGSGAWFLGLGVLAVLAILVFPLLFTFVFGHRPEPVLYSHRQKPHTRALIWGGLLWVLFEAVVKPISGNGFFSLHTTHPVMVSLLTLLCWMAYSFAFVYLVRAHAAEPPVIRRRAA